MMQKMQEIKILSETFYIILIRVSLSTSAKWQSDAESKMRYDMNTMNSTNLICTL